MLGSNDILKRGQIVSAFIGQPGNLFNKVKERVRVVCTSEQYRGVSPKVADNKITVERVKGNPHRQMIDRGDIHW